MGIRAVRSENVFNGEISGGGKGTKCLLLNRLFYRVHQRLLFGEVAEDAVYISLCDRKRWDSFVAEIKDVSFILFTEHADLREVDDIFTVTSDQAYALEAVLYSLKTTTEHVVLQCSLTVCVPDFYVVVVRLDVVEIFRTYRELKAAAVVIKGDFSQA